MTRKHLTIRLAEDGHQRIATLAEEYDLPVTTVVRALLAVAFAHPEEARKVLTTMKRVG